MMSTGLNPRAPSRAFDAQDAAAWRDLDRTPFLFRHNLANHPLFEIPRIARLAALSVEQGSANPYFGTDARAKDRAELTRQMMDRIHGLAEGSHWVKIIAVDRLDPEYNELMQSMLREVAELSGKPVPKVPKWAALTIFMNSPNLVVPYHFDHDTNFLMQVRGEKVVRLWEPSVVSRDEIEDFYKGNMTAGRYRDEIDSLATPYTIKPGIGVHHPPLSPHMVCNGSEVSLSVSFYYTGAEMVDWGRVHQFNVLMRKVGLEPAPPGRSAVKDWMKSSALNVLGTSRPATWHEMMHTPLRRIARMRVLAARMVGRRLPDAPA